jgi:hypothetical protein
MLATDYLLQRQQDLINKQADMIKELLQEIENKQEIIAMHVRLEEINEQLADLKVQSILTPSLN